MQSAAAASRRTFGFLASKIHPQLPLSARESQQLLNLLTTSFRAHLDREHPVASSEKSGDQLPRISAPKSSLSRALGEHASSSQSSAIQHIESVVTNPLFAVKPHRRESASTKHDAHEVLRDPLGWFLDQIAAGSANISKATICLEILERSPRHIDPQTSGRTQERRPGSLIAEWLLSSGLDTSPEFIEAKPLLFKKLVPLLVKEEEQTILWRWLKSNASHADESTLVPFRIQLLYHMVMSRIDHELNIDQALADFVHAYQTLSIPDNKKLHKVLQPTGSALVDHIIAHPRSIVSPGVFEAFLQTAQVWGGKWTGCVKSLLWLHHPSKPTAQPGFDYIRDSQGAVRRILSGSAAHSPRRQLLVQVHLGVARQFLAEKNFTNAQTTLQLARAHFPDLFGVQADVPRTLPEATTQEKRRREEKNLEMLDRLLPT